MAIEQTPRLGLPLYTSGTDLHPTREDFNERMHLLEEAVAIARQGTRDDRPLPSTRGTLFMETDTRLLWFDTGTEWIRVVRIGHDGPGRHLVIDGPGSEGSSEWAARADHTHPLPLASSSEPGAMSADDKTKLDGATAAANSNTLAQRNGSGQMSTAAPSASGHATNRGYVDQQIGTRVGELREEAVRVLPLPRATNINNWRTVGDFYVPSTQVAEALGFPNDSSHGLLSVRPFGSDRNWIFQTFRQWANPYGTWTRATSDLENWTDWARIFDDNAPSASSTEQGLMSSSDKKKLDDASIANNPGTIPIRSGQGRFRVGNPVGPEDVTNKRYVDGSIADATDPIPLGDRHLDDVVEPGEYTQGASANFDTSLGYPINSIGHAALSVRSAGNDGQRVQELTATLANGGRKWFRTKPYNQSYGAWRELS